MSSKRCPTRHQHATCLPSSDSHNGLQRCRGTSQPPQEACHEKSDLTKKWNPMLAIRLYTRSAAPASPEASALIATAMFRTKRFDDLATPAPPPYHAGALCCTRLAAPAARPPIRDTLFDTPLAPQPLHDTCCATPGAQLKSYVSSTS